MISKSAIGWLAAAALLVAGCSLPKPDPKADALARTVYDQVRHGEDAAVEQEMAPEAKGPDLKAQLAQIRGFIPPGEPKSVTLRSWNFSTDLGKGDTVVMGYVYDYGDKTTVSEVALVRAKGSETWLVRAFHVETHAANEPPPQAPGPPAIGGGGQPQAPGEPAPKSGEKPPAKAGDKT